MLTIAVWFWIGFHHRPAYPDHLVVHVPKDGPCISETLDLADVDCSKTHLTVAMPSDDGKRLPLSHFDLVCKANHIEVQCK